VLLSKGVAMSKVRRQTVDLTGHPDLVVVYLGMQVKTLRGVKTVAGFGPKIRQAVQPKPDGLLFHQLFVFGLLPLHMGIRQYWRDFDALERWVRSEPHRTWWRDLLRGGSGTAFWHETYFMRGGMESIFWTWTARPGCWRSPLQRRRGARCSRRAAACGSQARSWPLPHSPKRTCIPRKAARRVRVDATGHLAAAVCRHRPASPATARPETRATVAPMPSVWTGGNPDWKIGRG